MEKKKGALLGQTIIFLHKNQKQCLYVSHLSSGLLVTPGVAVCLPYLVLPCLVYIKDCLICVYSLSPCSSFLPSVCTVTEDQTYTVSGAHSPRVLRVCRPWRSHARCRPRLSQACLPIWSQVRRPLHCGCGSLQFQRIHFRVPFPAPDHSHVPWIHVLKSFIVYRNSFNLSSLVCLALSMETRLEQAAPLVMARRPFLSLPMLHLSRIWKRFLSPPCEGPWLYVQPKEGCHAQYGPQLPSPAPEEFLVLWIAQIGLLIPS